MDNNNKTSETETFWCKHSVEVFKRAIFKNKINENLSFAFDGTFFVSNFKIFLGHSAIVILITLKCKKTYSSIIRILDIFCLCAFDRRYVILWRTLVTSIRRI